MPTSIDRGCHGGVTLSPGGDGTAAEGGFTTIELLVVIAIIGVLMGLLIPAAGLLRHQAKVTSTVNKLRDVGDGLARYAQLEGSVAARLQVDLGLGGAPRFASYETVVHLVEAGGGGRSYPPPPVDWLTAAEVAARHTSKDAARDYRSAKRFLDRIYEVAPPPSGPVAAGWYEATWPRTWPLSDWDRSSPGVQPPILSNPWGRAPLAQDAYAPTTALDPAAHYQQRSDGSTASWSPGDPLPFDAGQLSPLRTIALLQAAEVLPGGADGAAAYRGDRGPQQPWNDAWGGPIVLGYGLYQAPREAVNLQQRDLYLKRHELEYGYNRALYVLPATLGRAAGPDLATVWNGAPHAPWSAADDAAVLRAMWLQIRQVAALHEWNETSFDDPPWTGAHEGEGSGKLHAVVLPPIELR